MSKDQEVRAAQQQIRETLISTGMRYANRLRYLRAQGINHEVAVAKGGGLALIFVKGDSKKGVGPHLRFGAPDSPAVTKVSKAEVDRWNGSNPNHEVEVLPIQTMLEKECGRVFTLLLEVQASVDRSELQSQLNAKED